MNWKRVPATLPLLLLPVFLACGAGGDSGEARQPIRPLLSSIQARVFDRTCVRAGCHLGAAPESRLSLLPGDSYRGLVNVPSAGMRGMLLVTPGDPEGSYLVRKLEGNRIVGERMPMGRPPLPPEAVAAIRQWIADGAPDR